MWRRCTAAKSALVTVVARNLGSTQNPKVVTHPYFLSSPCVSYQKFRFFSLPNQSEIEQQPPSLGWAPDGDDNSEADPFGSIFGQDDDTQLDRVSSPENRAHSSFGKFSTPEDGVQSSYGEFSPPGDGAQDSDGGFGEALTWKMDGVEEEKEEGMEDGGVYEVDEEKLGTVLSFLQSGEDGSLDSIFRDLGLGLHEEFVLRVIESPGVPGQSLIRFSKWAVETKGDVVTTPVVDALVRAICGGELRRNVAYGLWDFVRDIGEKGNVELNVESLNMLIALFSRLGKGKAALEVFDKLPDLKCVPDSETYYCTIEALCKRSFYDWGLSVCEKMLDAGCLPDGERVGKIISWLCKGSKATDAHAVYVLAKEKNKLPPRSALNILIGSLCQKDETVKLAVDLVDDFPGDARKYAIKPFSSVIRGLCRIKDLDGAKDLLLKMIAKGPPPGNAIFNLVISSYSKSGDMKQAIEVLRLMESRGLKPDVYSYTVVMSGYVSGGQMEDACHILSEAKRNHSQLNPVTYHTLIRGYCKLEQFDKALELLAEMEEFGVQPKADEYNKLIQSLCLKALDWATAEKLLDEMKERGLHLNGITQGLIRAVKELEQEASGQRKSIEV